MNLSFPSQTLSHKLQSYLFQYPQKYDINIHESISINSKALLVIRLAAFLVLSYRYVLQMQLLYSAFAIVQYLTNIGYILTWLYFTIVLQDYLLQPYFAHKQIGKFKDWTNLIFQIAICTQIPITLLFWSVLYDYGSQTDVLRLLKQLGIHGFPLFCLLLDFCFNLYQFPRRHLPIVILIGILYLVINISFSLTTQPVYAPLDWVSLMCYVYLAGCFIVVGLSHFAFRKIWRKYKQSRINEKQGRKYNSLVDSISNAQIR